MRALTIVLLLVSGAAIADEPQVRGNEVIVIEDAPPIPKVRAKPKKRYLGENSDINNIFLRPAPAYSERAVMTDAWTTAWLLLDISETGTVTRVKFLKYPGYDLEKIAVKTALALQFEPAIGADGKPARSYLIWPIEWPSYGWLVAKTGLASGIPDTSHVPCRGSGPLNLTSLYPTYRDCSRPNIALIKTESWRR